MGSFQHGICNGNQFEQMKEEHLGYAIGRDVTRWDVVP